jgi:putative SOS response-associated peptidase YedK
MCNDYAREIEIGRVVRLLKEMEKIPPFEYEGGQIPNVEPQAHIRISEKGFIIRQENDRWVGSMTPWAWNEGRGPVFNFRSEGRDFSYSDRCLILATGFYEYTKPAAPKVKLKDQHFFTMKGQEFFWIAGIVKHSAFAMLTTAPGPDVKPYHDRQVVVLAPAAGADWLALERSDGLLKPLPAASLEVKTLRRDGII